MKQCILSLFCHLFQAAHILVFLAVAPPISVVHVCCTDQGASTDDGWHETKMFSQKFMWLHHETMHFVTFLPFVPSRPHLGVFGGCSADFGCWCLLNRSVIYHWQWATWNKNCFSKIHGTSSWNNAFCHFLAIPSKKPTFWCFWPMLHWFRLLMSAEQIRDLPLTMGDMKQK